MWYYLKVPDIPNENNDINDVTLYRKKKKRAKRIRNLIIIGIIAIAAVLVYIYRDVIFEPLRGIASKVENTTTSDEGFPVDLPASSDYRFLPLSDSFVLVTDTYLYNYSVSGKQNFALQHGYVNPMAVSNSKRVLIYDKGGHDFALYNKSSEIYKQKIEDEVIVSAFISDNEHVAVVTTGGRYSNVVYVYDGNGKWLYTHKFIDDSVMQAAFSSDNGSLYLSRVKSDNGDIITEIAKYSMSGDGEELWSYRISDCVPIALKASGNTVTVIGDNVLCGLDADTGEEKGKYTYSGDIVAFADLPDTAVIIFDDYSGSSNTVTVFDKSCNVLASAAAPSKVYGLAAESGNVYVLSGRSVSVYDNKLEITQDIQLDDDYSAFVKIGSALFLMGYDTIEYHGI